MAILHYVIGLPPKRRGGSVQYAYDLMCEQSRSEKVYALTCGETLIRRSKSRIRKCGKNGEIEVYSLENPLTPTLIYGASDPTSQHRALRIDYKSIAHFIKDHDIRILHMHTLMGMHSDIVKYVKALGVKIVYTTHDFHGICPHYNMIDYEGKNCTESTGKRCALCNSSEPSDMFLRCVNSKIYQGFKSLDILQKIKKTILRRKVQKAVPTPIGRSLVLSDERVSDFNGLLNYYRSYFSLIDCFHFNSAQTRKVFNKFIPKAKGDVISIATSGIRDLRKPLTIRHSINLGFIGSIDNYKGFPVLEKVLTDLHSEGFKNLHLRVYSDRGTGITSECNAIQFMPHYRYDQLSDVMYGLDAVIVPSKWYETFSLVTLEAISHGRPVIVSDHVGAQDIVEKIAPIMVFHSEEELKSILREIAKNPIILSDINRKILYMEWVYSIEHHSYEILDFYKRVLS